MNYLITKPSEALLTHWYAEEVIRGNILASKKVILACKRHMRDLDRVGTKSFPWVFDEERAHNPIRFMEKFCKPSQGDYSSLVLQPWQHFIVGSLCGWVHKDTGVRRFREGLVFIGRKNGKTTMISALSNYFLMADNEPGARIYLLSNAKEQARLLFDESKAMVDSSPVLEKRLLNLRDSIKHPKSKSKIEPRASDSKKLDGLNTHLAVFDEIHEFVDYKLINVIKKSRGSRKQPLILYITTAGYQLDGPLVNYYEQGADVLDGVFPDERTFYYLAELDSIDEFEKPETWVKANPSMGLSLNLEILKEDWEKDKRTPEERLDFITKQFNWFSRSSELSYLDYETIQKNKKVIDINDLKGKSCTGAYDLSETEDFTSACLEFPLPETGEVFVLSHSWIPRKKVLADNEKIPYAEWAEQGLLTITKHDYVQYELVYEWFIEQAQKYQIDLIAYDRANAFRLNKDLEAYGFKTEKVRQGFETLSPAMKDLKHLFIDGKVISNQNPLLRWYINNVKLVKDRNGNLMPTKQNRYRKIDGFAALLNAHTNVMTDLTAPKGVGTVKVWSIKDLMGR
ncbi:terminase large subunit, partial [Bacillus atrophaeus]|uniref:terminase large subunit n=1 Tax=Bacillus atrophaeus TaxID=1452 RepID=UPI002281C308